MGEAEEVHEKRRFLAKIGILFGKFLSILPVVASILAPMSLLFGGFIYVSYILFLYPFIDFVNYFFQFTDSSPSTSFLIFLMIFEGILFLLGSYIFLDALITMSIHKKRYPDQPIVKKRLYKYIRHPQNLGILLLTIPFILYIPGVRDIGIRSGDILSWILFFLLTSILSIIEEKRMLKKHGNGYFNYIQTTGFYSPLRLQIFKNYTDKDTKSYMIQSILKVSIITAVFISLGVIVFAFGNTTLLKFPPPGFYISWEDLQIYQIVPFLIFLSCILGIGVYSLWNYLKKRKLTEKKDFSNQ